MNRDKCESGRLAEMLKYCTLFLLLGVALNINRVAYTGVEIKIALS